jgi:hypothetical protein
MINLVKSAALSVAVLASAFTFGAVSANAATCDGSWNTVGHRANLQKQCYYLPTVSNGRVTGVELQQNYRWLKPQPGAVIGNVNPNNPYYRPGKPK